MEDDSRPDAAQVASRPRRPRVGVALCLSGGGFRAALFHLGAVRRLNELGILSQVDTVTAVSGGSLFAAHLAARVPGWPEPGERIPDWEERVAAPFRRFARHNLRTGPLVVSILPRSWGQSDAAVWALERRIRRDLAESVLADLPLRPKYIFSATNMTFGSNWIFERDRVGDYQLGYLRPDSRWTVGQAVAASSSFPPFFNPMRLGLEPGALKRGRYRRPDRGDLIRQLQLTDGGLYDNMGLEPVWKSHRAVLVSDGGGVFDFTSTSTLVGRLLRYSAVVGKQATAIRRRWLIAGLETGRMEGAYWTIGSSSGPDSAGGYPAEMVDGWISRIRTDLDAFSPAEIAVLENHGYLLAEVAVRARCPHLIVHDAPLAAPHEGWLGDEARVGEALRDSNRRTPLGRFR